MGEILRREAVYLWYYFSLQLEQILGYWILGMVLGSVVSVFFKDRIHHLLRLLDQKGPGEVMGIAAASALGIASPLCMYGTIPIAASFSKSGMKDQWLGAFMMSSILLNPQLAVYSMSLGGTAAAIRLVSCFLCGMGAGICIRIFFREKGFFRFESFTEPENHDTDPNVLRRFAKNLGRNVKATGPWFLLGILLSALFQRYVPARVLTDLFGGSEAFGVLMAATVGVPLYVCGGGTIPLLQIWLADGMSMGAAAAFMITGPATKITNLGALKIVLGAKRFGIYLLFVMACSLVSGLTVNCLV